MYGRCAMSRIGKKPVIIPEGVEVTISGNTVTAKGSLGENSFTFKSPIVVKREENTLVVTRPDDEPVNRCLHGTTRSVLENLVLGVKEGFSKTLIIEGVGYRFQIQGSKVVVSAGFSKPFEVNLPKGVKAENKNPNNPNELTITGFDKQVVGQIASEIREIRKPEPYLGKGIRYSNEIIRRKEGKVAK